MGRIRFNKGMSCALRRDARRMACVVLVLLVFADLRAQEPVAASIGGRVITVSELDAYAAKKLWKVRMDEYVVRRDALQSLLAEALLKEEASRRGLAGVEQLVEAELQKEGYTRPSDLAINALVQSLGAKLPPSAALDVNELRTALDATAAHVVRRRLASELMSRSSVSIRLRRPDVELAESWNPTLGPENAPVTIVEFSDFQCPYCALVAIDLKRLAGEYPEHVRLVYRHYPLSNHVEAPHAAVASLCANRQGKFWLLHDSLFANQKTLSRPVIRTLAGAVGLDLAAYDACIDGDVQSQWKLDKQLGDDIGVQGTPHLLIDGLPVAGAVGYEKLKAMVEDALAAKSVASVKTDVHTNREP